MKKPGFFEGVTVAMIASLVISASVFFSLTLIVSPFMLEVIISIVCLAYISYLMIRSGERLGRMVVFTIWFATTILAFVFTSSLTIFILFQLGVIWIVRSLYFYDSVLAALLDLGLIGLGALISIWAWYNTGNVFIAMWCFFLMQALFVFIPHLLKSSTSSKSSPNRVSDQFDRAHLAAEQALRQITSN